MNHFDIKAMRFLTDEEEKLHFQQPVVQGQRNMQTNTGGAMQAPPVPQVSVQPPKPSVPQAPDLRPMSAASYQPGSIKNKLDLPMSAAAYTGAGILENTPFDLEYKALQGSVSFEDLFTKQGALSKVEQKLAKEMIKDREKEYNRKMIDALFHLKSVSEEDQAYSMKTTALKNKISNHAAMGYNAVDTFTFGALGRAADYDDQQALETTATTAPAKAWQEIAKARAGANMVDQTRLQSPMASTAGAFVGEGLKYGIGANAIKGIPVVGNLIQKAGVGLSGLTKGKISAEVMGRIAAGRFVDLPIDVVNCALDSESPEEFAKNLGIYTATGLAMDGALEGIAFGWKQIKAAAKEGKLKSILNPEMIRDADIDSYISKQHQPEVSKASTFKPLPEACEKVALMDSVSNLTGGEFKKSEVLLPDQVSAYFDSLGGTVKNQQLGIVEINRRGIKDSMAHGIGRKKSAAFAAVPDVIAKGEIINHQLNWKNRGYETYVIAAPVQIAGERNYVGAIVISEGDNRFYLHEVLTAKSGNEPFKTGRSITASDPGGSLPPSLISLLRQLQDVNPPERKFPGLNSIDNDSGNVLQAKNGILKETLLPTKIDASEREIFPTANPEAIHDPDPTAVQKAAFANDRSIPFKERIEYELPTRFDESIDPKLLLPTEFDTSGRVVYPPTPSLEPETLSNFGKNTAGAAQSTNTGGQKVSQLYENTFQKTKLFTTAEKHLANANNVDAMYKYDVIKEKQSLKEAAQRVTIDFAGEEASLPAKLEFNGVDTDTAVMILSEKIKAARETGDYTEVKNWAKMIQEKGTEAGQRIQAFAKYSRTPEGTVVKAEKAIQDFAEKLSEDNPKLVRTIENLANKLTDLSKKLEEPTSLGQEDVIAQIKTLLDEASKINRGLKLREGTENKIKELIDSGHGSFDAMNDLIREMGDIPTLSNNDVQRIMDIMANAEKFPLYSKERLKMEQGAWKVVADKFNASFMDKWNTWRYMAMLGNPRTHVRNFSGNVGFGAITRIKNNVGALIEAAADQVSKDGIDRTKALINPFSQADNALFGAAKNDFNGMYALVMDGGKYNPSNLIQDNKTIFKGKIGGVTEKLRKFNFNMLELEDELAMKARYSENLTRYLKANGYGSEIFNATADGAAKRILENGRTYAIEQAQKATFRDNSAFANWLSKLSNSNKVANVLIEGIMPFKKTPINIVKRGVEYSPIGLGQGVVDVIKAVKNGSKTPAEAIDKLAAGITGTGLMGLGAFLASKGLITGSASEDQKERDFDTLTGGQKYAITVGGKSYTLDWAAPASLPMFTGVEAWKTWKQQGFSAAEFFDALTRITEPITEMTMLQGLNDAIQSAAYNQTGALTSIGTNAVANYMSQPIPTLFGQVARSADDTRRTAYYGGGPFLERILPQSAQEILKKAPGGEIFLNAALPKAVDVTLQKGLAKIPGASMLLEPKIDQWGREQKNTGGSFLGRMAYNMLSPGYYSEDRSSDVDRELKRLYDETGEGSVLPGFASKTIGTGEKMKRLTGGEYTQYAKEKGGNAFNLLQQLMGSETYQKAQGEAQKDMVTDVYEITNALAKKKVADYEESSWIKKAVEAQKDGIPFQDYIVCKNELSSCKKDYEKCRVLQEMDTDAKMKEKLYHYFVSDDKKVQEKLKSLKDIEYDVNDFLAINAEQIESDKDEYGNSIAGSAKENKIASISKVLGVDSQEALKVYKALNAKYSMEDFSSADRKKYKAGLAPKGMTEKDFIKYNNIIDGVKGTEALSVNDMRKKALVDSGISEANAEYFVNAMYQKKYSLKDFTEDQVGKYQVLAQKYNLSERRFVEGYNAISQVEGNKDAKGKTISGSLKSNRLQALIQIGYNEPAARIFLTELYGYKW